VGRVIQICEAKGSPKKQNLRTQINGEFNDISRASENERKISL
jgi:hypothetical protein